MLGAGQGWMAVGCLSLLGLFTQLVETCLIRQ